MAMGYYARDTRLSHLQFFAVSNIEPTWNSSMTVRMWGVTVAPSKPIINSWPFTSRCQPTHSPIVA
jgi:hypothetical protein